MPAGICDRDVASCLGSARLDGAVFTETDEQIVYDFAYGRISHQEAIEALYAAHHLPSPGRPAN